MAHTKFKHLNGFLAFKSCDKLLIPMKFAYFIIGSNPSLLRGSQLIKKKMSKLNLNTTNHEGMNHYAISTNLSFPFR